MADTWSLSGFGCRGLGQPLNAMIVVQSSHIMRITMLGFNAWLLACKFIQFMHRMPDLLCLACSTASVTSSFFLFSFKLRLMQPRAANKQHGLATSTSCCCSPASFRLSHLSRSKGSLKDPGIFISAAECWATCLAPCRIRIFETPAQGQ